MAIVEMALVGIILVFLLFGILVFGYLMSFTVVPMITSTLGVELGGPMSASSTSSARDRRSSVEPVVTSGG